MSFRFRALGPNPSQRRESRRPPLGRGRPGEGVEILVTLLALSTPLEAQAQELTLSGRWSAADMRVAWNMGQWGAACGPRPSDAGAPAGTVNIVQESNELNIQAPSRHYSTTQCWEQFPGLSVKSHVGGKRGWRTVCKTAPNDPRQATVTTSINASDVDIVFDEVGQYQFVVEGQNCTASVRRSRLFRLLARAGEPAPVPERVPEPAARQSPAPTPIPTAAATRSARCSDPGPPSRLEVEPSRKLMRPGEQFQFRSVVLDAAGCPLGARPTWAVLGQNAAIKLTGPGAVSVPEGAPEGEYPLTASVEGQAARVVVEVASRERYEALLRAGGFDAAGRTQDSSVAVIASSSIGTRGVEMQDRAESRRRVFVLVMGALLVLAAAGIGIALYLRRRARRVLGGADLRLALTAAPPPPLGTVCPTCRREYPPQAKFCPADGNRVVALQGEADSRAATGGVCPACGQGFDPGVSACPEHGEELVPVTVYRASAEALTQPSKKICPICGLRYPGDAQFCGTDGAHLVPVN